MSHITRRKFLKKSAGVVAAVIVGPIAVNAVADEVKGSPTLFIGGKKVIPASFNGKEFLVEGGGYIVPRHLSDEVEEILNGISRTKKGNKGKEG